MIFDPVYWLVIGAGALLSFWASARVKSTFNQYSRVGTRAGYTGADIARRILRDNDIHDVTVEPVAGALSDHYDPRTKTLRLSEPVFSSHSMAAVGVAAHEVGHAIQHARAYGPLKFRSAWVPVASTGGNISLFVIMAAVFMGAAQGSPFARTLGIIGVALFATTTIFTLVTLPVEFDASKRALATLERGGYTSPEELAGAKKVLDAAALTYVAAFLSSLIVLIYWIFRLGLLGGRSDD